MSRQLPILWMIIPCYNEEQVLPLTAPLFDAQLNDMISAGMIRAESRILFVNDGSKDHTWEIIQNLARSNKHFIGISQSRNRGHQNAVWAGLMEARQYCDITISIDCDGQDDIKAMTEMVKEYLSGADIVYGVRSKRDTDTFFKRVSAESYYRFLHCMGAEVVFNHADYRLISKKVLDELSQYHEVNLFLRGLVPLVGFKSTCVAYERAERMAGESHYPLKKMIALAMDGITSLSNRPLHIIMNLGIFVAVISFLGVIWAIISALSGNAVSGWASVTCIVCFVSGVQLICLGVIGQYIGKIYMETKARPKYIISERTYENTLPPV